MKCRNRPAGVFFSTIEGRKVVVNRIDGVRLCVSYHSFYFPTFTDNVSAICDENDLW